MSLEYQKFTESLLKLSEAENNLGLIIKKFGSICPRKYFTQLILKGGRRSDSKLIEAKISNLTNNADWAFVGIVDSNKNPLACLFYDYEEKSYKYCGTLPGVRDLGSWERALHFLKNMYTDNTNIYLLDSNRSNKLSSSTKNDLKVASSINSWEDFYELLADIFYRFERFTGYSKNTIIDYIKERGLKIELKIDRPYSYKEDSSDYDKKRVYLGIKVATADSKWRGILVFGRDDSTKFLDFYYRAWFDTGIIDDKTFRSTNGKPGWHRLNWRKGWDWST